MVLVKLERKSDLVIWRGHDVQDNWRRTKILKRCGLKRKDATKKVKLESRRDQSLQIPFFWMKDSVFARFGTRGEDGPRS